MVARSTATLVVLICLATVSACDRAAPPPPSDASRVRRVFAKPPSGVRAVPPHAIRRGGVGPYQLGMPLEKLLALSPRGPRVALMRLDGVLDFSLVEAENDMLVVGVLRGAGVSFVTVLDREIARTEKGVGVGATDEQLREKLGASLAPRHGLRDPRIHVYEGLPNARFIFDGERAAAVLLTAEEAGRPTKPGSENSARSESSGNAVQPSRRDPVKSGAASNSDGKQGSASKVQRPRRCSVARSLASPSAGQQKRQPERDDSKHAPSLSQLREEILRVARFAFAPASEVTFGCLDPNTPMALVTSGGRLAVVVGAAGKLRSIRLDAPAGLVFAGALDTGADGRDEIVVVSSTTTSMRLAVSVSVYRYSGGRFIRVAQRVVYRIAAASTRWVGTTLGQIELLLEVDARQNSLRIAGMYVQRDNGTIRNIVPIERKMLPVRGRGKPAAPTLPTVMDAGVPELSTPPRTSPSAGGAKRDGGGGVRAKSTRLVPRPRKKPQHPSAK